MRISTGMFGVVSLSRSQYMGEELSEDASRRRHVGADNANVDFHCRPHTNVEKFRVRFTELALSLMSDLRCNMPTMCNGSSEYIDN